MNPQQVRCADIRPDPRSSGYPPLAVEVLANDIRAHGVLRPLLLRTTTHGYVIVHGERRWQAARMAGLDAVPAFLVHEFAPLESVTT